MIECPNCGKDVDNLEVHNHQFHDALEVYGIENDDAGTYKCSDCGQDFDNEESLGDHETYAHSVPDNDKHDQSGEAKEDPNEYPDDSEGHIDSEGNTVWDEDRVGEARATERGKKEIQKEIDHLQEFINVASFENPLNMGADNKKLSALQVEWANATEAEPEEKWDKDDDIGRNFAEPVDDEIIDDDSYWAGRDDLEAEEDNQNIGAQGDIGQSKSFQKAHNWTPAEEIEHQQDKPEISQKDWEEDLAGLKDDYATEDDEEQAHFQMSDQKKQADRNDVNFPDSAPKSTHEWNYQKGGEADDEGQKEVEDFVDDSIKDIYDNEMPEKPSATEEEDAPQDGEDQPEVDLQKEDDPNIQYDDDGKEISEEQSDEDYAEHENFQDYMDQEDERAAYDRGDEAEDDKYTLKEIAQMKKDNMKNATEDEDDVEWDEKEQKYKGKTEAGKDYLREDEEPRCDNCGDLEDLNDDGLCDYCHQEAGVQYKESERDAYEKRPLVTENAKEDIYNYIKIQGEMPAYPSMLSDLGIDKTEATRLIQELENEGRISSGFADRTAQDYPDSRSPFVAGTTKEDLGDSGEFTWTAEGETETSDDGTDVNTPQIPDVDDSDTDEVATFSMESWDRRITFNTKVQAFEGIGLTQGDALKLAELNWRELSIEVRGELNEFADNEKEEKRLDIQDAFNDEGAGDGADQPDTTIDDLDEIDYNIIGDNPVAVEKYECEHCNSGFKSNEALMIHYNDTHASAREFMLDVPNTCTYCGQEIPANVSMGEHLAYEHGISLDVKLENGQVEDGYEGGQGSGPRKNFNKTMKDKPLAQLGPKSTYASLPEQAGRDPSLQYDPFTPDPDPIGDPSKAKLTERTKIKGNENLKKKILGTEVRATETDEEYERLVDILIHASVGEMQDAGEGHERYESDIWRNFFARKGIQISASMLQRMQDEYGRAFESWEPHVYKATETVSYAEEDDIDEINDINKHAARGGKYNKLREPWETGSDWNRDESGNAIGEEDFKEDEHPREDSGKFTSGGDSGSATKQKSKPKLSKNFNKAKDKILKHMGEPKDDYDRKTYNKVKNLDGYPQHSSQLKNVSIRYKAPIMKAHLNDAYPDSKWSVRTEYFSMGSALNGHWTGGGGYPYGANKEVAQMYTDRGASNMQVDYSDVDNYVSLYDGRSKEEKGTYDPQTIADSREERIRGWISGALDRVDYMDSRNWSSTVAQHLAKDGKIISFQGMTDDHKEQIKKAWSDFQEQEKKEGGQGSTGKQVPKSTTQAFTTQQYMNEDPDKPSEIPFDLETGKDLPVSTYNPNAAKYRKPDLKDTKKDVTKARSLMKGQKGSGDEQPWQKGGEAE